MLENFFLYINFINQNLENHYLIFFLIYSFSLIIFFSFSIPGGPILLIATGFFFGFYAGFVINMFSILIGSYFFVYFAKSFFKKFFDTLYVKFSKKLNTLIKYSSYEYLIIIRLIQGNPLFIQNLCLSFLNISKTKFIITSFIGFSPAIIIFTYLGSKLLQVYEIKNLTYNDIFSNEFIFILILFILFLIFRIIYNYKKND